MVTGSFFKIFPNIPVELRIFFKIHWYYPSYALNIGEKDDIAHFPPFLKLCSRWT